jgi:hypothetical protein
MEAAVAYLKLLSRNAPSEAEIITENLHQDNRYQYTDWFTLPTASTDTFHMSHDLIIAVTFSALTTPEASLSQK